MRGNGLLRETVKGRMTGKKVSGELHIVKLTNQKEHVWSR